MPPPGERDGGANHLGHTAVMLVVKKDLSMNTNNCKANHYYLQ